MFNAQLGQLEFFEVNNPNKKVTKKAINSKELVYRTYI